MTFFLLFSLLAGINTAVVPLYLSEIAPVDLRGEIGTISQLSITSFILLATILGLPEARAVFISVLLVNYLLCVCNGVICCFGFGRGGHRKDLVVVAICYRFSFSTLSISLLMYFSFFLSLSTFLFFILFAFSPRYCPCLVSCLTSFLLFSVLCFFFYSCWGTVRIGTFSWAFPCC